MNASELITNETMAYAAQYMIAKLIEAGKTQEQVAAYMVSDEGMAAIVRLGAKFLAGAAAMAQAAK